MDKLLGASFLFLWLQQGAGVNGQQGKKSDQQQVKQSSPSLTSQEGAVSILNCTYENSAFDYFPWYRQCPGKGPELLIAIRSVENKKEMGRFIAFFNKNDKQFSLHIKASQPGDSATYLCAASTQCSSATCSLNTNLPLGPQPALLWGLICQRLRVDFIST